MQIKIHNEDDDEMVYEMPGKFELCPRCKGKGTHVNPNVDSHGISQEEFDDDPSFAEDYFSGVYDVECDTCKGLRVVESVDERRLDSEQKAIFAEYRKQELARQSDLKEWNNEIRMQNAMGGDW